MTLIARNTADGTDFVFDDVPLGKTYWVEMDTAHNAKWERSGKVVVRYSAVCYDSEHGYEGGMMPLELLRPEVNT